MSESEQQQTKKAFLDAAPTFKRWDPSIILSMLGDELHTKCGCTVPLNSMYDIEKLSDEECRQARKLLPEIVRDLPAVSF